MRHSTACAKALDACATAKASATRAQRRCTVAQLGCIKQAQTRTHDRFNTSASLR